MCSRSTTSVTPLCALTRMLSYLFWPSRTRSAVDSVNSAMVAPARLSEVPYPARPVIVKCSSTPPRNTIGSDCPTVSPFFAAVPASTTTSVGCVGAVPLRRRYGEIALSVIQLAPNVGGPLPPIGFPLWPISVAPSRKRLPTAAWTPGTARTVASSEVGIGWFWPPPMPPLCPAIGRPCTVTATPAFAVAKMLVNVALIVSVRMNVPATNETPRMTAIVVSASRSL